MTSSSGPMAGRRTAERTGPLWWTGRIVAWLVIFGMLAVVSVAVLVPRIGGATPYAVLTGSMRPHYPPGTLVVMKPADTDRLGVGTVITYQLTSGVPTVVTHRVVGLGIGKQGERTFITQGDANNVPDAKPVRPVQVRGQLWYSVPYVGYVNKYVTGGQRQMVLIAVEAFLVLYAGFMLTSALLGRRRKRVPS